LAVGVVSAGICCRSAMMAVIRREIRKSQCSKWQISQIKLCF